MQPNMVYVLHYSAMVKIRTEFRDEDILPRSGRPTALAVSGGHSEREDRVDRQLVGDHSG
jgi:hypothetical protein